MPRFIEITASASLSKGIEDILIFVEYGIEEELKEQILYLPFMSVSADILEMR